MNLNKNETGQLVYADLGQDVSTATGYTFILEPKYGEKLEKVDSDGVVLGTTNITINDENLLANQYVKYTIKDGDLSVSGQWRTKGQATISNTNEVIGDYKTITVLP